MEILPFVNSILKKKGFFPLGQQAEKVLGMSDHPIRTCLDESFLRRPIFLITDKTDRKDGTFLSRSMGRPHVIHDIPYVSTFGVRETDLLNRPQERIGVRL